MSLMGQKFERRRLIFLLLKNVSLLGHRYGPGGSLSDDVPPAPYVKVAPFYVNFFNEKIYTFLNIGKNAIEKSDPPGPLLN